LNGQARLTALMARGAAFFGSEYAILAGAMSWVSERNLVAAMSNAGCFGVIACGAMTPALLDAEIAGTKALTAKPFGVNLITMHPDLDALIDVCTRHQVGHVVLAGGLPPGGAIEKIKTSGAKVVCFAPALALAKKLIRSGVDALVEMGAAGVQLGTRFVCAHESIAHPNFKKAFIRASARDAVASVQIDPRLPVIPVRALKNASSELFTAKQREVAQLLDEGKVEMMEAQLQIEHYWAGALRRAVIDGDVENGSLMAGQSVGMVTKEEPLSQIVATLLEEAATALERRAA
jgi:enoyl-[acyl-carrier protein] reductase II